MLLLIVWVVVGVLAVPIQAGDALLGVVTATWGGRPVPSRGRADTTARLGAVVIIGRAGWEAKFVAAALEERGWSVRLRVSVAPGIVVTGSGRDSA